MFPVAWRNFHTQEHSEGSLDEKSQDMKETCTLDEIICQSRGTVLGWEGGGEMSLYSDSEE